MQAPVFQEAVEKILSDDRRYHADAYAFLRDALDATLKRTRKSRKERANEDVSAPDLLEGFRQHALQEFGPMAITVLDYWGVRRCEDIGHMVFNLVQSGVFGKTDSDTLESFRGGYAFEEAFVRPFHAAGPLPPGPPLPGKNS